MSEPVPEKGGFVNESSISLPRFLVDFLAEKAQELEIELIDVEAVLDDIEAGPRLHTMLEAAEQAGDVQGQRRFLQELLAVIGMHQDLADPEETDSPASR